MPSQTQLQDFNARLFVPSRWLPDVSAGMVAGLLTIISSISNAALIYSGDLASGLPGGIQRILLSAAILLPIIAMTSSFRFAMSGPDATPSALLAVMVATLAQQLTASHAEHKLMPTVAATIAVSTLVTGGVLFALGRLRLGRWIRFIPYPVIGGFLAGAGWLLVKGAFTVMAGAPLSFVNLARLAQPQLLWRWLPGLVLALALLFTMRQFNHYLVMPVFLFVSVVVAHLILWIRSVPLETAIQGGWFLEAFASGSAPVLPTGEWLTQVEWPLVFKQGLSLVVLVLVTAIGILLNASGIEIATKEDADLDRELRAAGLANCAVGLCGGLLGHQSLSRSVLAFRAGGVSRLSGLSAAALIAIIWWRGAPLLRGLPKPVLGGLLLYLGLGLLLEWCYEARYKLPLLDYGLVLLMLLIIAFTGFLTGVGLGVIVACVLFVLNYSRLSVIKHALSGALRQSNVQRSPAEQRLLVQVGGQVQILYLQGYIFFGTAQTLLEHVRQNYLTERTRYLLLEFRQVNSLDSSALFSFTKLLQLAERAGVTVLFADLAPQVEQQLRTVCQPEQLFADLDYAIEWCEIRLLQKANAQHSSAPTLRDQLLELSLTGKEAERFISYLDPVDAPTSFTLFKQGEPPSALYFVETGQVTVQLELPNGEFKRLRVFGPGTIVGEIALYTGAARSATVSTDRASKLYQLTATSLDRMQTEAPLLAAALGRFVIGSLAERLQHREKELQALLHS